MLCKRPWRFNLFRFRNVKTCIGDGSHLILKNQDTDVEHGRIGRMVEKKLLCWYSSHLDRIILSYCSRWSSRLLPLSMYFPGLRLIYAGEVGQCVHHNRLRVLRLSMSFPADLQRPKTLTDTQMMQSARFFPGRNHDTYFFPSLTPPTRKAFHKGFIWVLR